MNKKKLLSVLLAGAITATAITVPAVAYVKANEQDQQTYQPTVTSKEEKTVVNLLDGDILKFVSDYKKCGSDAYAEKDVDKYAPKPATISWESEEGALYYTVKLSQNADLSDCVKFLTFTNEHAFEDLFMGTKYYYQVTAHFENKTVKSQIFSFETAYLPRTIYAEGVSNTRDAGGYYTADGKHRVRQGMIYRGAKLEDGTEAGLQKLREVYKIKTDLDLRAEATESPLGQDVNFVNVSGPYYAGGSTGISSTADSSKGTWQGTYRDALLTEIRTFANPDNYPIYAHCSLGRDRTGTIIFLINALCGVGETDLFMDYELTFFSKMGLIDNQTAQTMVGQNFTALYNYLKGYTSGSLAQSVEKYMKNIGITQAEIDSIRNILLEEV